MELSKERSEFSGMLSVGCAVLRLSGRVFRVLVDKEKLSDSFVCSLMRKQ